MLDPQAKMIFDLSGDMVFLCRTRDGHIVEANKEAKARIGDVCEDGNIGDVIGVDDAERILNMLTEVGAPQSGFVTANTITSSPACRFQIARFPSEEDDIALVQLRELSSSGLAPALESRQEVGSIGEITNRIMHDVRNLIFPLVGHVELAMASLDTSSEAYASLLDVQSACRNCDDDLSKLVDIAEFSTAPRRFVHPVDLMERSAKVLGYTLPKSVEFHVDVPPSTPLIEVSIADFHQRIVDLAALAFQQRGAFKSVFLGAEDNSAGGVSCEIRFESQQPRDEGELKTEMELTRAFLTSLLIDSKLKGSSRSTESELRFYLEVLPKHVSHVPKEKEDIGELDGSETLLLFHPNDMMRDIIASHLHGKGYEVKVCKTLEALTSESQIQKSAYAVFADCEPGDKELKSAIATLLLETSPSVVILACADGDAIDDDRIHRMSRSYRLDSIPTAIRQAFDHHENDS